jgi:GntR family transcriptional regulator
MLIVVDPHSGVPVYRQLMDQIRLHVASGLVGPGDELPSTRTLSAQLGVNPMTVSKAYGLLEREQVLERRPGRPLTVATRDDAQGREDRRALLRESLMAPVTLARQLGLARAEALDLFASLLADDAESEKPGAPLDRAAPSGEDER